MTLAITISFDDERGDKIMKKLGSIQNDALRQYIMDLIDADLNKKKKEVS
jgi:hypothetical protein